MELFANGGLTSMTAVFFPRQPPTQLSLQAAGPLAVRQLIYQPMTGKTLRK